MSTVPYKNKEEQEMRPGKYVLEAIVSVGDEEGTFVGLEKSVAAGEVYSRDDVWYTVDEADLNKDIA